MHPTDTKILELIDLLKASGKIKSAAEFCREVGFLKQNIRRIKSGEAHFGLHHLQAICRTYNVNANWVIGGSNDIFNSPDYAHKLHTNSVKIA